MTVCHTTLANNPIANTTTVVRPARPAPSRGAGPLGQGVSSRLVLAVGLILFLWSTVGWAIL